MRSLVVVLAFLLALGVLWTLWATPVRPEPVERTRVARAAADDGTVAQAPDSDALAATHENRPAAAAALDDLHAYTSTLESELAELRQRVEDLEMRDREDPLTLGQREAAARIAREEIEARREADWLAEIRERVRTALGSDFHRHGLPADDPRIESMEAFLMDVYLPRGVEILERHAPDRTPPIQTDPGWAEWSLAWKELYASFEREARALVPEAYATEHDPLLGPVGFFSARPVRSALLERYLDRHR